MFKIAFESMVESQSEIFEAVCHSFEEARACQPGGLSLVLPSDNFSGN